MDLHLWGGFALASLVVAIVPGPGVASIVGFAFSSGRRTALASVSGMAVGNATAMAVSLAGAGAVLASWTTSGGHLWPDTDAASLTPVPPPSPKARRTNKPPAA